MRVELSSGETPVDPAFASEMEAACGGVSFHRCYQCRTCTLGCPVADYMDYPPHALVRLVQLLYLTGPFETVAAVLQEFKEPVETEGATYEHPDLLLRPYLPLLAEFERLKHSLPPSWAVYGENGEVVDPFEGLELWVTQQALAAELETINSLLCDPCGCTLCCTGPEPGMSQEFFEIPLTEAETRLFSLPVTDSAASRRSTALSEPPLAVEGQPFYARGPGLFHWRNGWGLVLPKNAACPQLEAENDRCRIYPQRPRVCRRPQIFAYILERWPEKNGGAEGEIRPAYRARRKLLAIWDCPYVRALKAEIAAYAEMSGVEPVFRENKA